LLSFKILLYANEQRRDKKAWNRYARSTEEPLLAGDGDYVPLILELKRLGKVVYVAFFSASGLSPELRLAADGFFELEPFFFDQWKRHPSGVIVSGT